MYGTNHLGLDILCGSSILEKTTFLLSSHGSSCGGVVRYVTALHLEWDMCNLPCHCWHVSCFHGDLTLGTALLSFHGCVFPILPRNHCLATGVWGLWLFHAFFPPSFLFPGSQSRSCVVDVSVGSWHFFFSSFLVVLNLCKSLHWFPMKASLRKG